MEHLQDYTLNDINMQSIIKQQLTRTNSATNSKEQKKRAYSSQASTESSLSADTSFFEPREADSLFWILFVMQYGVHEYNSTIHRNVILEKKCKFEFIEKIRQNKSIVKTNGYPIFSSDDSRAVGCWLLHVLRVPIPWVDRRFR
jgi:hypothetical protein